jgi:hypothetical protein
MEKSSLLNTHFRFFPYTVKAGTQVIGSEEDHIEDPILRNLWRKEEDSEKEAKVTFYLEDVIAWSQAWTKDNVAITKIDFVDNCYFITDSYEHFNQVMLNYINKITKLLWIELYDTQV